jgi:hypothetical protein
MDHISQSIDNARPIKIEACRLIVLQRIVASAFAERLLCNGEGMTPKSLE